MERRRVKTNPESQLYTSISATTIQITLHTDPRIIMPVAFQAPPAQGRINLRALLDASYPSSGGGGSGSPVKKATMDLEWEPFHSQVNDFMRSVRLLYQRGINHSLGGARRGLCAGKWNSLTEAQLDIYAQNAKQLIAQQSNQHTREVRTLNARKEETDRRINIEREREAQMLAGERNTPRSGPWG